MFENTNAVIIPREDYNILLMSQTRLDDIRLIAASDQRTYSNRYDEETCRMIDALLGIEQKEKPTDGQAQSAKEKVNI